MTGEERRKIIIEAIKNSDEPLSGGALGRITGVSRQVVVQDIALLRAQVREFLASYLNVPFVSSADGAEGTTISGEANAGHAWLFDEWLCRDTDWMLPPGRYC